MCLYLYSSRNPQFSAQAGVRQQLPSLIVSVEREPQNVVQQLELSPQLVFQTMELGFVVLEVSRVS